MQSVFTRRRGVFLTLHTHWQEERGGGGLGGWMDQEMRGEERWWGMWGWGIEGMKGRVEKKSKSAWERGRGCQ